MKVSQAGYRSAVSASWETEMEDKAFLSYRMRSKPDQNLESNLK